MNAEIQPARVVHLVAVLLFVVGAFGVVAYFAYTDAGLFSDKKAPVAVAPSAYMMDPAVEVEPAVAEPVQEVEDVDVTGMTEGVVVAAEPAECPYETGCAPEELPFTSTEAVLVAITPTSITYSVDGKQYTGVVTTETSLMVADVANDTMRPTTVEAFVVGDRLSVSVDSKTGVAAGVVRAVGEVAPAADVTVTE